MAFFLLGLFAFYLVVCWRAAQGYVYPERDDPLRPDWVREVNVPGRYGETPAWATPGLATTAPSPTVFVLAHGYGGTRATWTLLMQDLRGQGFDAVAPALPGQDQSPARGVGFGIKEGHVLVETARWARARGAKHVVVLGVSMGGAAAWLGSAEDPQAFDAVVTEGAYARFDEAMNRFLDRVAPVGHVGLKPVVVFASAMAGLNPSKIRPVESAKAWRGRPALVIQGTDDELILASHAERLAQAADCPTWWVPGARHAQCYDVDPKGYVEKIVTLARKLSTGPEHERSARATSSGA